MPSAPLFCVLLRLVHCIHGFTSFPGPPQAITGVRDGKPTCASTVPVNESCAYPDLGVRDVRHIFFCEPGALRNELDFSPEESLPFTTYAQVRGAEGGRGGVAAVVLHP
jgi:hypothetical protein